MHKTNGPVTPRGINHLVLNVLNLEESHRFWTEIVGFRQVGELKPTAQRPNPPKMRFYSRPIVNMADVQFVGNGDNHGKLCSKRSVLGHD